MVFGENAARYLERRDRATLAESLASIGALIPDGSRYDGVEEISKDTYAIRITPPVGDALLVGIGTATRVGALWRLRDAPFTGDGSVPLPADAVTDRVFVALKGPRRGQPLSADGLDEVLTGARERAGLAGGTCHELRHTCFTRLRQAGMPIEAIQAQAGHRSIASTRVYLHLGDDWLAGEYRRAAEAIEAQAMIGTAR